MLLVAVDLLDVVAGAVEQWIRVFVGVEVWAPIGVIDVRSSLFEGTCDPLE